jgi:murein DD-endopeptidase MepM/ murein hydrolase activator NlpD
MIKRTFIFLFAGSLLALSLLSGLAHSARIVQGANSQIATPLPNPLDGLPTPAPTLEIVWRPPLYPVPWALTDQDHFYFTRPIAADRPNWPLSVYRYAGTNFGANTPHTGVDFVTAIGTPVMAAANGKVVWSGYGLFAGAYDPADPYGIAVMIQHDFSYDNKRLYTVYAHLSESLVVRGQHVEQGDVIARSGDTGLVTDGHLHFEVRMGSSDFFSTYNPELWVVPPQGWGVLVGRITDGFGVMQPEREVRVINQNTGAEIWSKTYGTTNTVNMDPYYRENFVLSDLPAGEYRILIPVDEFWFEGFVTITPGAVSFFSMWGRRGIEVAMPPIPTPSNLPVVPSTSP